MACESGLRVNEPAGDQAPIIILHLLSCSRMLNLEKISLTHFKNYQTRSFSFDENIIGICGLNGVGKTNLLDAIYYCCFTRSYFTSSDALNTRFNEEGFRLEGYFKKQDVAHKVVCINRGVLKKELSMNDIPYEKFSQHIGLLPVVIIAPDDIEIITGNSEGRRKFADTVLSQINAGYLQELITYNKILQQRNSLLKKMYEAGNSALTVLDILDSQLVPHAKNIHAMRRDFLEELIPIVQHFYALISGNAEKVFLSYVSQLNEADFASSLKSSRDKDILLQRTNVGIHKDDISFLLDEQVFKQIASQGQRKSLLFALKLAEFEMLKKNKGFAPLLLLDDVFEKLDDLRMQQLLQWVCNENDGKVFITDTHKDRLEEVFQKLAVRFQIIEL